jgi:hypothetical protein
LVANNSDFSRKFLEGSLIGYSKLQYLIPTMELQSSTIQSIKPYPNLTAAISSFSVSTSNSTSNTIAPSPQLPANDLVAPAAGRLQLLKHGWEIPKKWAICWENHRTAREFCMFDDRR